MSDQRDVTPKEKASLEKASRLTELAIEKWSAGNYPETEPLFKEALEIWERVCGPQSAEVAQGLYNLASLYNAQSRYDTAAKLWARSVAIDASLYGADNPTLKAGLYALAQAYFNNRQYAEARSCYERIITIIEKEVGTEADELVDALLGLAHVVYFVGEYAATEPFLLRALAIAEKVLGIDDVEVAHACQQLARLYHFAEALGKDPESYYRRTFSIYEKTLGPLDEDTVEALYRLADYLGDKDRYEEADPLFEQWRSRLEQLPDSQPEYTWWMINGYKEYLVKTGRAEQAQALADPLPAGGTYEMNLQRELETRRATLGNDHPDTALSIFGFANMRLYNGDLVEAESLHREALAIRERYLGIEHPDTGQSYFQLAKILRATSRYDEADDYLHRALAIEEQTEGKKTFAYAMYLELLAFLRADQDRRDEWETCYREALAILDRVLGPRDHHTAESLWHFAGLYMKQDDYTQAEAVLHELAQRTANNDEINPASRADYLEDYAAVLEKSGKTAQANEIRELIAKEAAARPEVDEEE
jgi:tetratricopeptide (TPR) repeat protein